MRWYAPEKLWKPLSNWNILEPSDVYIGSSTSSWVNCPGKCHKTVAKTLASLWGCYRPLACRYKTSKELKSPKPRHFTRTLLVLTLCYALLRCLRLLKSNWSEREQGFVGFVGLADPSGSGSPSGSVKENNKNIHIQILLLQGNHRLLIYEMRHWSLSPDEAACGAGCVSAGAVTCNTSDSNLLVVI